MEKKSLSEKQLGKRPLVQSHARPRVEQRPPPKKTQVNASQVEEPIKKKEKSRCCYLVKVTSCEPHVDNSTTSTKNAILPCASPRNPSTHNVGTSCDELLSLPFCSNNDASTSSSTCVVTNHVEERNEHKVQATSVKKGLEKRHEGKSALDNMLSVQQSPNDKSRFGFNSSNKNKSKIDKKKGQESGQDYLLQV